MRRNHLDTKSNKIGKKEKTVGTKYKFGVKIPRTGDIRGALKLDRENGNRLWYEAQKREASALRALDTFIIPDENFDFSEYQYVPLIYAWDIKFDGRHKARLVVNGAVTVGPSEDEVWLGVVDTNIVWIIYF